MLGREGLERAHEARSFLADSHAARGTSALRRGIDARAAPGGALERLHASIALRRARGASGVDHHVAREAREQAPKSRLVRRQRSLRRPSAQEDFLHEILGIHLGPQRLAGEMRDEKPQPRLVSREALADHRPAERPTVEAVAARLGALSDGTLSLWNPGAGHGEARGRRPRRRGESAPG